MALCSAAEVRAYDPSLVSAEDTLLDLVIGKVGAVFARYCGYPPASATVSPTMEDTTYTHYSKRGTHPVLRLSGQTVRVPCVPIVSITSVHDDPDMDYATADLVVDGTDFETELLSGEFIMRPDGTAGAWSDSVAAIKVVYVAGFATVPDDLKDACILQTLHAFRGIPRIGLEGVTQLSSTVRLSPRGLLPDVKAILDSGFLIIHLGVA